MKTKHHKIGERVNWTSQSSGHTKWKEGAVVEVVPPGQLPSTWGWRRKNRRVKKTRNEVSYVVQVKSKLYWPLTGHLNWSKAHVRNTHLGPFAERPEIQHLELGTRIPEKWVIIDAETLELWIWDTERHTWTAPKGLPKFKVKALLEKIRKKL
jgi:uncharacterized protein YndB with AHSA1/START domain